MSKPFLRGDRVLVSRTNNPDRVGIITTVNRDGTVSVRDDDGVYFGDGVDAKHLTHIPVDQELFNRTAPRWNCVDFPNEGMHCLARNGSCTWCGATKQAIAQERTHVEDWRDLPTTDDHGNGV